jgi:hypothetical protein
MLRMRLAFARLMKEHRWPESINHLIELLADTRIFGSHLPMGWVWLSYPPENRTVTEVMI